MAPSNSLFKLWRLECHECGQFRNIMCWNYELPNYCTCGHQFHIKNSKVSLADTKKIGVEVPKVVNDIYKDMEEL